MYCFVSFFVCRRRVRYVHSVENVEGCKEGGNNFFASQVWRGKRWEEGFREGGNDGQFCMPFMETIFFRYIFIDFLGGGMVLQV